MRPARLILPFMMMMTAACDTTTPPGEKGSSPGGSDSYSSAPELALLPSGAGGMTAAASGMLAVRGRCLGLEAGGARINLAFATARTRWDVASGTLRIGDRVFRPGTRIEIGGGQYEGDAARLPWLNAPAAECRERIWIVSSVGP